MEKIQEKSFNYSKSIGKIKLSCNMGKNTKNDSKTFDVILPESYPQKEFAKKKAKFVCKIFNE